MKRPSAQIIKAKHHEISVRYGARESGSTGFKLVFRVAEIDRLLVYRYGQALPDDDAGREDARIMVHTLSALSGNPAKRIKAWIEKRTSWMTCLEIEALTASAIGRPLKWSAGRLGKVFRLTDIERTKLKIRTIAPYDVTAEELALRRKDQQRKRMANQRRAKGARDRNLYETSAVGHGQPWIAAGVSRATWYRQQAKPPVS